ncbi:hypothetical protein IF2G_00102 [Cordyceps javanica]|nr:hypothetical protein IF2G_00102 [Cordyceps javanica]
MRAGFGVAEEYRILSRTDWEDSGLKGRRSGALTLGAFVKFLTGFLGSGGD